MTANSIPIEEGPYRYLLTRDWLGDGSPMVFVMLNPSTATQDTDDPTIRRCIGFAHREGAAGLRVVNLFAYRATDPSALQHAEDPVGPHNDQVILTHATIPGALVVAAWGTHGRIRHRATEVKALLTAAGVHLMCLGRTRMGDPRHPLYLPADTRLLPFRPEAA